jgi:signal transduction histidine kinase
VRVEGNREPVRMMFLALEYVSRTMPGPRWVTYGGAVHNRLTDLGVTAVTFGLGLVGPGTHNTDWSLPLGAAIGTALYWRRRSPFGVLVICFVLGLVQLGAALAGGLDGPALPGFYDLGIIVAIYSAVAYGTRTTTLLAVTGGLSGAAAATLVWARTVHNTENAVLAISALFAPVLLAWALGTTARTRRAYLASLEDRAERLQREREALARVAVAEERERIARELHDILAHSVSLMVVQSDGADAAIEQEKLGEARKAVAAIGRTGRDALADLRLLLGTLRSDRGLAEPQPGIDQLQDLIGSVPLKVRLRVDGKPRELPQGLALAVFRIVQEALTNTVKHAGPGASADVRLTYSGGAMEVEVADDGRGPVTPGRSGHGLIGMRERVAMFGGTFTAGPRPSGGFRVLARLPWM